MTKTSMMLDALEAAVTEAGFEITYQEYKTLGSHDPVRMSCTISRKPVSSTLCSKCGHEEELHVNDTCRAISTQSGISGQHCLCRIYTPRLGIKTVRHDA